MTIFYVSYLEESLSVELQMSICLTISLLTALGKFWNEGLRGPFVASFSKFVKSFVFNEIV